MREIEDKTVVVVVAVVPYHSVPRNLTRFKALASIYFALTLTASSIRLHFQRMKILQHLSLSKVEERTNEKFIKELPKRPKLNVVTVACE